MGGSKNENKQTLAGLTIVINNMKSVAAKALRGVLLELMEVSPQIAALATVSGSPEAQELSQVLLEGTQPAMSKLTKILTEKLEEFRKLQQLQAKGVSYVADAALGALGNVLDGPGGRTVTPAAISGVIKKAKIAQDGIGHGLGSDTKTPHPALTQGGTRRHKKTPKKYRKKSHRKHTRRQRRQHMRVQRRQRRQHTRFRRKQTSLYKRR